MFNFKKIILKVLFLNNNYFICLVDFFGNLLELITPKFLFFVSSNKKTFLAFYMLSKYISLRLKKQKIKKIFLVNVKGFGKLKFFIRKTLIISLLSQKVFFKYLNDSTSKMNGFMFLKCKKSIKKIDLKIFLKGFNFLCFF